MYQDMSIYNRYLIYLRKYVSFCVIFVQVTRYNSTRRSYRRRLRTPLSEGFEDTKYAGGTYPDSWSEESKSSWQLNVAAAEYIIVKIDNTIDDNKMCIYTVVITRLTFIILSNLYNKQTRQLPTYPETSTSGSVIRRETTNNARACDM